MARIDEIVDGIYRISTTIPLDGLDFQFAQFLIDDAPRSFIRGCTPCTTTSAMRLERWSTLGSSST